VKRLISAIALLELVMIVAGSPDSPLPDTGTPPTDSNVPDNESPLQSEASNSSPSATVTIAMTGMLSE
jgi:hypothetical protein